MDVPILLWAIGACFIISVLVLAVSAYRGLRTLEAKRREKIPSRHNLQRPLNLNSAPPLPRQATACRTAEIVARNAAVSPSSHDVNRELELAYAMSRGHARIEPTRSGTGFSARQEVERRNGLKYATATLLAVGLTSTVAQFVAAASLGITQYFEWEASSGGLIALLGSIYMWAKCPNWEFWKRWIWLWVGPTVILAFITINLASQTLPG